jgi:hypothetical protein
MQSNSFNFRDNKIPYPPPPTPPTHTQFFPNFPIPFPLHFPYRKITIKESGLNKASFDPDSWLYEIGKQELKLGIFLDTFSQSLP